MKKRNRFTSRRFLFTALVHGAGLYLMSQGHVEVGGALMGLNQGSYNVGQSWEDAAKAKAAQAVKDAISDFNVAPIGGD